MSLSSNHQYITVRLLQRGPPVNASSLSTMDDDLRSDVSDCGVFRQFALPASPLDATSYYVELSLDTPLTILIGGDGILTRQVSLCSGPIPSPENTIAQGILKINFLRKPQAASAIHDQSSTATATIQPASQPGVLTP